ncbi:CDP-glucose 4,6-dehydratase [Leptospira ognonensis]|uniref:CDP-glucose 4,6-dehydratase n=1 Tax=Leptospira ognonensis TaxID=2484945 RepID=A0A4R9K0R3_9LEPT|nr:CDP-glucose 4,6-dehydratase [Leptospira ognonensis]
MDLNSNFWKNKRVFITGHTGFKGSWLTIWLSQLGAEIRGYALAPATEPALFDLADVSKKLVSSNIADIRDLDSLKKAIEFAKPDIVFHMAAQPLVRDSYTIPVETFSINVMGTVNILEAIRTTQVNVKAFINITTDKVYENREWIWGYRESDRLGGHDPYSNSKACSELVTSSYRNSYFHPKELARHELAIATVRAGNVIGGGDFATDRLFPDIFRSIIAKKKLTLRNPLSIRPWQHVLEPLRGYIMLAERLYKRELVGIGNWNFGPNEIDAKSVETIVKMLEKYIGHRQTQSPSVLNFPGYTVEAQTQVHEAHTLKLDITQAKNILGWIPRWNLETAIGKIVDWTESYLKNENMESVCLKQIQEYSESSEQGY